jgi:hypothetical protein
MELAALDHRMVEHLGHRAAERLGAVDHDQDRPGGVQPPLPQPDQQIGDHGGVLGGALGQGQRDLGAVDGDAESNHAGVGGHPDPVYQQRHQVQVGQVLGEQLGQGVLGAGDEPARDRRLGGAHGRTLDVRTDGLQPDLVAARGQLGQHPLHRELVEQVGGGERLVGRHGQLSGAVGGPDPGAADPHPAATQGHLARLAAMAHRSPLREVAALGTDQPGDILDQHGLKHLQAGPHRQGQQPLAGGAGKLGDRDGHPLGQVGQVKLGLVGGGGVGILRHGGPLLVELLGGCPTPTTRQASGGDRHPNFYGNRDNLS